MPGHTYTTIHIPHRCQHHAEFGNAMQCNLYEGHTGVHRPLHEELTAAPPTIAQVRQIVREEIRTALAEMAATPTVSAPDDLPNAG